MVFRYMDNGISKLKTSNFDIIVNDIPSVVNINSVTGDFHEYISFGHSLETKIEKMSDISHTAGAGVEVCEELLKNLSLSEDTVWKDNLRKLQCIFTWGPSNVTDQSQPLIESLHSKEDELEEDEAWTKFFQKIVINFVLCYEYSQEGKFEIAMLHQKLLQEIIQSEGSRMKLCLQHMTIACKAYLEFYTKQYKKLKTTLEKIIYYSKFDDVNKAAVWGLKAAIYMNYGYEGCKLSVGFAEEAIKLDPNCGDWHFLCGKSLGRIRRVERTMQVENKKELMALEKAAELCPCAAYYVFLAQAYQETSKNVYRANRSHFHSLKNILKDMNEKSVNYFRKSLELSPDSVKVNIRCAVGFSKLPRPFKDLNLALACLEKAMETAPTNRMALHTLGHIHELKGDLLESEKILEQASELGVYGSHMDLIRIRLKLNPDYNPLPLLEEILLKFTDKPKKCETLAQIGLYYFIILNNFNKALHYWQQLLDIDPESDKLKGIRFSCLQTESPINIERIIIHEIKLLLQKNHSSNDSKYFTEVLDRFKNSYIIKESPIPQRDIIMDRSNNLNINRSKLRNSVPAKHHDKPKQRSSRFKLTESKKN